MVTINLLKRITDRLSTYEWQQLRLGSYLLGMVLSVVLGGSFMLNIGATLPNNSGIASLPLAGSNNQQLNTTSAVTKVAADNTGDLFANYVPDGEFELKVAKIGLSHKVVPNVNPADEAVYGPVINNFIAHGEGTLLPDEAVLNGNVYLFSHRQGIFKRLGELRQGDTAVVRYHGSNYIYQLRESFIITPQDTWVYTPAAASPTLTLQTCEQGEKFRLILQFDLVHIE